MNVDFLKGLTKKDKPNRYNTELGEHIRFRSKEKPDFSAMNERVRDEFRLSFERKKKENQFSEKRDIRRYKMSLEWDLVVETEAEHSPYDEKKRGAHREQRGKESYNFV